MAGPIQSVGDIKMSKTKFLLLCGLQANKLKISVSNYNVSDAKRGGSILEEHWEGVTKEVTFYLVL